MSFNFTFRTPDTTQDIRQLVDFLMKQHLGYPGYEDWVQRSEVEIDSGYKVPIMAFSEGHLVGDLIYQRHKELPRVREIKNIRIHPGVRRRDFAHFMLKQAERDNPEQYDALICDARSDQRDIINLLRLSGYRPIGSAPLYDSNTPDIIMVKVMGDRMIGLDTVLS
ncbi:hypothetical protein ACFL96_20120 [Thermoproteota archaeon]